MVAVADAVTPYARVARVLLAVDQRHTLTALEREGEVCRLGIDWWGVVGWLGTSKRGADQRAKTGLKFWYKKMVERPAKKRGSAGSGHTISPILGNIGGKQRAGPDIDEAWEDCPRGQSRTVQEVQEPTIILGASRRIIEAEEQVLAVHQEWRRP
jgi:hypothetical protein